MEIPTEWQQTICAWAEAWPRIIAVYIFGSRAKGTHQSGSDLDIAYLLSEDPSESAFTYSIFQGDNLRASLAAHLPVEIDLQFADPEDDVIVWPAVLEHGVLIYERR